MIYRRYFAEQNQDSFLVLNKIRLILTKQSCGALYYSRQTFMKRNLGHQIGSKNRAKATLN